jgi:hypothetical protein
MVNNLSKFPLSGAQIKVLSKGLNYAIESLKIQKFNFLKAIEASTVHFTPDKINEIKAKIKVGTDNHKIREKKCNKGSRRGVAFAREKFRKCSVQGRQGGGGNNCNTR